MDLCFIADAPASVTLNGKTATSRVQIAKTGKFSDPRYGKFSIGPVEFERWIANFQALARAGGRAGLPVDVDHGPERTGKTEAAGWITALERKRDELWATVEWNSLGQELVGDRRYLYLSPTYRHDYQDETGRSHGTALVGVALTNRPFLSMATVSLSEQIGGFALAAPDSSDSRPAMKTLLDKLGLAEDATEEQAVAALDAKLSQASPPGPEKTLDQLASENGKVVLSTTDFTKLAADAASGAAAAAELHKTKFDTAWAVALSEGKVTPAEEEGQRALYAAAPDAALSALTARQPVVKLTPAGHSGHQLADGTAFPARDAEGYEVDQDSAAIDARATVLMAERKLDYQDAVILAAQEIAGVTA